MFDKFNSTFVGTVSIIGNAFCLIFREACAAVTELTAKEPNKATTAWSSPEPARQRFRLTSRSRTPSAAKVPDSSQPPEQRLKQKPFAVGFFTALYFFTVQLCALHESVTSRHRCTSAVSYLNVLGTEPQGLEGTHCGPGKTQQTSRPLFGLNGEVS